MNLNATGIFFKSCNQLVFFKNIGVDALIVFDRNVVVGLVGRKFVVVVSKGLVYILHFLVFLRQYIGFDAFLLRSFEVF